MFPHTHLKEKTQNRDPLKIIQVSCTHQSKVIPRMVKVVPISLKGSTWMIKGTTFDQKVHKILIIFRLMYEV